MKPPGLIHVKKEAAIKTRVICSLVLTIALIFTLCIPANAAGTIAPKPAYEVVVPLEFNQIYQVSGRHELMVVERYGSNRDPQRALVTFRGDEVLKGTDILLCSYGILCRTRDWNGDNPLSRLALNRI